MKAIIVDDEQHVREGLMLLGEWSRFGIDTIMEAADGNEAIKLIKEHRPEIIFTDMSMPKRDGISLLKWIHSSDLSSKTIVVSGYDDFDYMRNAICYKSFDYILKPIDPDILNEILERAINEWNQQNTSLECTQEQNRELNVIQQIEQFLLESYNKDINLQEIADRFYLSREYISRKFKQEYQATITDFITNVRISKAKELLLNPKLKIYEIAFQVGYQDEKYFSKVFKKTEGISPNEYRSMH
ncbi:MULTISPECIES: response regulator transcription factor [unclassified Cytobacillus]|uniref:response regulator transcription factor n=1 Tax=unclassified Cytobacillus TaxID=2675268 RepID=UPI001357AFC7|nr:response regulator [Cytobacillus sp. AMY 15.2]KAF0815673.1 Two-component response regulator yesN [Bacillus sp. ZZV12-4809]MCM3093872.1 response regulator [Cytobacillus sp. AMY 15.2]